MNKCLISTAICVLVGCFLLGCSDSDNTNSVSSAFVGITGVSTQSRVKISAGSSSAFVKQNVPFVVTAVDSSGAPCSEVELGMSCDVGGTFGESSYKTDAKGYANITFTPSVTGTNIISASAGGSIGSISIQVAPAKTGEKCIVTGIKSSDYMKQGEKAIFQFHCADASGKSVAKATVAVVSTPDEKLEPNEGLTDDNGFFTTFYTAPSSYTGVATITAAINGVSASIQISVRDN